MFLYYFPACQKVTAELIEAQGLAYALTPGHLQPCQVIKGPDGGAGIVCGHGDLETSRVGHFPQRQSWRQYPGREHWVGIETEPPTTPAQLLRPEALAGHQVTLGDGRQWVVPLARAVSGEADAPLFRCALPHQLDLDDSGGWTVGAVASRHAGLWQLACDYFDARAAAELQSDNALMEFDELHDAATQVLQTNYRIDKLEAVLLGLFTGGAAVAVLEALIDMPGLAELIKKKQADTTSGQGGDSD